MRPLDPDKREKIIQSVFLLAGREGLASVNIAGISKTAGIAIGTLYTYFKNKEEAIQSAYSSVEGQMTQKMYAHFDLNLPVRQSLKQIYLNMLNYRLNHYNETVFIDQYIQSNYIQLNFEKQMTEFEIQNKPLYDLLRKGQQEGLVKNSEIIMMISFFDGSVRACSTGIIQKLFPLTQEVTDHYFDMIWRGIT